ncbi:treslin-like [Mercenaria mercenaria]|uniref:treslin-like n=1 Tax=Mercenaria mercenaria TaxID=6596 RepID=UPI00234E633C|nr:treslin-like [Mercenaria mercenaria]
MCAQIVFVIDTNLNDDSRSSSLLSNSICLSCIRLLSHLSSHFDKHGLTRKSKQTYQKLKWGYKFFNSKVHHTKIESHKLYDFKLRYLEEFENELQRRFESAGNGANSESGTRKYKPVDSLNKAFTEILADFKWDSQELWSPVKGKRFRKEPPDRRHLVVLFTKCPKTFMQLKEFTGKRVLDEEIFLNSLFPNMLFQQFCKIAKLTLYWIDTQHFDTCVDDLDLQALDIVKKSVEKTGGGLASLHAFAGHGCTYFTNVQDLLQEESWEQEESQSSCNSTQLLPLATVTKSCFLPGDNKLVQKVQKSQNENCFDIQLGNKAVEILVTAQNIETRTQKKTNSAEKETDISKLQSSVLQGYAVLRKSWLGCRLPVQASYLCAENVRRNMGKTAGGYTEGLLKKMIKELASKSSILVLVCTRSGQLVLLEPLTTHTATLSLLSVDTTLSLEKQLLLQNTSRQTSADTVQSKEQFVDEMVGKLVGSVHLTKGNDVGECIKANSLDGLQMDRWVVAGRTDTVQKLITKLNDRISELDFLSHDEVETLKQLSKSYRKEKQPPGLRDTSVCNHVNAETKIAAVDKADMQQIGKSSQASLSRIDKILCKSKEVVQDNIQKKAVDNTSSRQEREKPNLAAHLADFQTEEELKNYLTSTYERTASGEVTDIDSCIQSMITVALHYFKLMDDKTSAKENCWKLLEETLLVSGSQLREKYSHGEQVPLEQKVAGYQSQILLRIEMISTLKEQEKTDGEEDIDEVVGMLRTLSFISEPGLLSKFMQSSLLHSYMHTIPRTLGNIYDELMQPLPESLANILSPEEMSANQSGVNESLISDDGVGGPPSARTRSHGSVGPLSNQPVNLDTSLNTSRGGRKLVHHYSMVDYGSKRQIVVDKPVSQKLEKRSKQKIKSSAKKRRTDKVTKSPYERRRGGVKLERRQSVAVMERTHKTPKKNKASKTAVTPSRQKGKLVAETPCHKQVSSMLNKSLQLQQLQMDVIKESPEKSCDLGHNISPTKGKRAKALLRRSFYSAGPTKRTKNLTQYFQLANRIAGRQQQPSTEPKKLAKLISFETPDQFKSPDKNSSFLLSQLGASPSPAKATPRKLTKTPNKVADSPCHNTRSKCESPSIDLSILAGRHVLASPVSHLKQNPRSRQQSPRVLVAESGVKKSPGLSQTTPEKSPALGVVTFGLDSPSQNTRQRLAQTPTRKSVRAALFAKSPVARNHSPFRATASPRTLLDKFGSPLKTIGSPVKTTTDIKSPKNMKHASPVCNEALLSQRAVKNSVPSQLSSFANKIRSDKQFGDEKHSSGSKTPSPNMKKVTKTPDSFDKWRRMKPRMSQPSPSVKMTVKQRLSQCRQSDQDKINSNITDGINLNQSKGGVNLSNGEIIMNQSEENEVKGSYRKKRCLLESPEKSVGSFSKRRRTGNESFIGSQGFDMTGSFNELSQKSIDSTVDYFSATNDDVFLSQSQNTEDMDFEEYDVQQTGRASKKRLLLTNSSENERSESPIFGCSSRKSNISKTVSEDLKTGQKNTKTGPDSGHSSPVHVRRSPATKKYSPNVSAKSLMHLIQSPLLRSPDGGMGKKSSKALSPRSSAASPRSKAVGSRRSLKMIN